MKVELREIDDKLFEKRELKNCFDSNNENSGKERLKTMRKEHQVIVRSMELIESIETNLDSNINYHALHLQEAELSVQIKELEDKKLDITKRVAELSKQKQSKQRNY